ncbi:hypothetical protein TSAR_011009 [Trichomalopsis sarcophagae]|uniref:acid phosphatase n=1 Tax=Trichomalopsis sarcophagae TaxID=543379 RepID=A0A232F3Y8_9HYME|nr:hypothetical protein TSAR_011009 [Trichomalopsis sarcophagae]
MKSLLFWQVLFLNVFLVSCNQPGRDMRLELVQTVSILFLCSYFGETMKKSNLIKLFWCVQLFRHGERTVIPAEFMILDYAGKEAYEPYGFGQLTNNGKREEYRIGQMLRQRYEKFLDKAYVPNHVYAYSSEDDRTKMSLQLVLAGLYPPSDELVWNKKLDWIPSSTRYQPKRLDFLMKPYNDTRFWPLWRAALNQSNQQTVLNERNEFIEFLQRETGKDLKTDVFDLVLLYNALHVNDRLSLPLPDWYKGNVKRTFRDLYAYLMGSWASTTELKKINGGPLVKTFLKNMNLDNARADSRKIYLYSGHDYNLMGVRKAHGINDNEFQEFGSGLLIEKWRDSRDKVFVKLLSWASPGDNPKTLRLKDCEDFCPVENYIEIISDSIPTDKEINERFKDYRVEIQEFLLGEYDEG